MNRYLLSYDISSNSIRGKAYRFLKKKGLRIQKSVFLVEGTTKQLEKIQNYLVDLLDENDSLLILPCCDNCYARAILTGKQNELSFVA